MRQHNASSHSVHVVSVGPYGRAVAEYLGALRADVIETTWDFSSAFSALDLAPARVRVVAAWRPVPLLCRWLDDCGRRRGETLIPLILDCTLLQLGPVMIPPHSPCWDCHVRRSLQHSSYPLAQTAVWEFYDRHTDLGPRGFLEPFATIGASMVAQTIDTMDTSRVLPGYIRQIDLLSRNTTTGRTIGVDACVRCGRGRSAVERSSSDLKADLEFLWAK
jgi:hypothetical protein